MPIVRKVDDEVRVKVMAALLKQGALKPNVSQIKRQTGLNQATVRASLAFLEKTLVYGYHPKIDPEKVGFGLEVITIYQFDISKKEGTKKFSDAVEADPHVIYCYSIAGSTNWNLVTRQLFRNVEEYLENVQEYYARIPELYELVQDKMVFYAKKPLYKKMSYAEVVARILQDEMVKAEKEG